MAYRFSDCDRSNFFDSHSEIRLGEYRVRYFGFALPHTQHLPPVVLIGGAFQNAWSFHAEVAGLLNLRPVIIIELPGQGGNTQVCEDCSFSDLAELLENTLDELDLQDVVAVGLSYGAAIVHRFAVLFPQRASQIVLVGAAPQLPPAAYRFSLAFAWLLHRKRIQEFATALAQHLFNVCAMNHTGVSVELMQRLAASITRFDANQIDRFDANLHRLHVERLQGQPQQATLVLAGRHDSFIPPHEALAVAKACPRGEIAISTDCDHLAPLERPERLVAIYRALLSDESIGSVPSMLQGAQAIQALKERRLSPRCWGQRSRLILRTADGYDMEAELVNISSHGCRVHGKLPEESLQQAAPWLLHFPEDRVESLAVLYDTPGAGDKDSRFLFFNTDFDATANLKRLIQKRFRCEQNRCPQGFATAKHNIHPGDSGLACIRH